MWNYTQKELNFYVVSHPVPRAWFPLWILTSRHGKIIWQWLTLGRADRHVHDREHSLMLSLIMTMNYSQHFLRNEKCEVCSFSCEDFDVALCHTDIPPSLPFPGNPLSSSCRKSAWSTGGALPCPMELSHQGTRGSLWCGSREGSSGIILGMLFWSRLRTFWEQTSI